MAEGKVPISDLKEAVLGAEGNEEVFAKASQAAAFAVQDMFAMGDRVPMPENTGDWIKQYVENVWAYAGIFALAATISQLRPVLKKTPVGGGESVEVKGHNCISLLRRPNDSMTGLELLESLVIYLETAGTAYWEVVYGDTVKKVAGKTVDSSVAPTELWPIRPDRITPEPRKDGHGIERYAFQTRQGGKKRFFKPDEIVPFRYFNPMSDWYGLGSLQPAGQDLRLDSQMAKWNVDFFAHAITPEGLLKTEKQISPHEMKTLGEQIKQFLAGKGRQVLILGKGLEWQTVSVNPKDIEFLAGRRENRQAILAALGVPPVMVGLLDHAKYDNYALQIEAFHKDTVLPKVRRVEACLESFYVPLWPDLEADGDNTNTVEFDKSTLSLEDIDRLTGRLTTQISYGLITPKEAARRLGLPEQEGISDEYFLNSGLVPVSQIGAEPNIEGAQDQLAQAVGDIKAKAEAKAKSLESRLSGLEDDRGD